MFIAYRQLAGWCWGRRESCATQLCCNSNKKQASITTVCRIQISISQLTIMICAQMIIIISMLLWLL